MIFIEVVFLLLLVLFSPLVIYQLFLSIVALFARKSAELSLTEKKVFAIVVPAHNEEKIISKTIYSLSGLIYPKSKYDVFVIADNCTDNTAALARSLGTNVLERNNELETGKGYALRWAFDSILNHTKNYDALIVIDADSLVSGNFLEIMNDYLSTGSQVIQSSDLVLSTPGNWSIEATRIGFLLYNYVKPLGRKVLGLSMGLRGNGMCFSAKMLTDTPWQAWSLTEDVEYGLILQLKGIHIDFAPEALVYAQMPVEAVHASSQRVRWEMGRYQVIRAYTWKFLVKAIRERSIKYVDVFLDLITPPFVNLIFVMGIITSCGSILWMINLLPEYLLLLWIGLFSIGFLYLFIGLFVGGADKTLYKSLYKLPLYLFWKLKVYIQTIRHGRQKEWIRTERDLATELVKDPSAPSKSQTIYHEKR
jgi:cellulose synthase/poly-beta-1,6-N-acetylglucosamine synthase-like glycosyltransferase